MRPSEVRRAQRPDARAIAAIYNQGIEDRVATFRTRPIEAPEVEAWLEAGERFPVLVRESGGAVEGWSRVVPYSESAFYAGVGEYMLYVERRARRRGTGRALLEGVCAEAQRLAYWKLIGKLFTDNRPSIALAHACGFRDVGVHLRHGRLDGEWRDVLVMERLLGEAAA
ncbi:MAG: arsinothricin resistance N-acetyltransferase ArsN1 family A [Solirubrobacteraceae bacterium]